MKVLTAPERMATTKEMASIFLAGSIEMGKAHDWQSEVQDRLNPLDVIVFNPRRDDWDTSWRQDISNDNFRAQVEWELDHLDIADVILFYFDPNTKAPITLMELGLFASSGKCLICCPEGYWRRGNIQIICARYNIPLMDNISQLIEAVQMRLEDVRPL